MYDLKLTGIAEAQRQITGVALRVGNLTPAAPAVFAAVQMDVARRFDSAPGVRADGVTYGGVEWRQLTDRYIRAAKREGGKQLQITGQLQSEFQLGGSNNIAEVQGDTITFGSSSEKASGLNVKRRLLAVHPALVLEISGILGDYVTDGRLS